ncbi:radical SAM protein, partial [PVC group bacterium]|nr:radical SAM protein [PVC group bacterium]
MSELFESIQGESSYAGMPCFFIRLSGCNLDCTYCDTPQASGVHMDMGVSEILERVSSSSAPLVEITGGEPLLQDGFSELAEALSGKTWKHLLVETNGSMDRDKIPYSAVAVMDIKCPGS